MNPWGRRRRRPPHPPDTTGIHPPWDYPGTDTQEELS